MATKPTQEPYKYVPYPRWIHFADGRDSVLVQNAEHETAVTGIPMNEDGTPSPSTVDDREEAAQDGTKPPPLEPGKKGKKAVQQPEW